MTHNIITKEGWVEVVINRNAGYKNFEHAAKTLKKFFHVEFSKLDSLDASYWDFVYKGCELTLHYNIYLGISLFPKALKLSSQKDNECVKELGELLIESLKNVG